VKGKTMAAAVIQMKGFVLAMPSLGLLWLTRDYSEETAVIDY